MHSAAVFHPRRRDDLFCQELDGEAILYDGTFNTTYRLNETGYLVFQACNGLATSEDIAGLLIDTYDVTFERAHADVRSTIARMHNEGLLLGPEDA